jgi:type IV secretory pathway TraG/TraD family ATPase VirD4
MTKTNDENDTGLQSAWTTGHAAATASVNQAGVEEAVKSFFDPNDVDHKLIFAPTRTGMSAGMIFPQVLDQSDEPKR